MSSGVLSGIDDSTSQRVRLRAAMAPETDRRVDAHFWFAPGIEVWCTYTLPVPPPPTYEILLVSLNVLGARSARPEAFIPEATATFHLTDYVRGSEVAHYELCDHPPKGYQWFARNGAIFHWQNVGDEAPIAWGTMSYATTTRSAVLVPFWPLQSRKSRPES